MEYYIITDHGTACGFGWQTIWKEVRLAMAKKKKVVKLKGKSQKIALAARREGSMGGYGSLTFETSDKRILTPRDFKQTVSGQWGKHNLIGRKPKTEFIGADLRSVTFTITLSAVCGVKPRAKLKKIEKMIESGFVDYLVIGNKTVGKNKFRITDMSEAWEVIYSHGEVASVTLDITMEEYV